MLEQVQQTCEPSTIGTCLIVEDSEFDTLRMERVLSNSIGDVQVEVATTLKRAREILQTNALELILLDNNLPDGLGANFVMELAEDPELSQIPVIIVSDWPSPFMWDKAETAGVHYVLDKREFDGHHVQSALEIARSRQVSLN